MKNFVLGFLLLLAGYQTVLAQEVLSGEKAENYIKKHFVFTGVEEVFHEKAMLDILCQLALNLVE